MYVVYVLTNEWCYPFVWFVAVGFIIEIVQAAFQDAEWILKLNVGVWSKIFKILTKW